MLKKLNTLNFFFGGWFTSCLFLVFIHNKCVPFLKNGS